MFFFQRFGDQESAAPPCDMSRELDGTILADVTRSNLPIQPGVRVPFIPQFVLQQLPVRSHRVQSGSSGGSTPPPVTPTPTPTPPLVCARVSIAWKVEGLILPDIQVIWSAALSDRESVS